jgi:hypothetical protein
MDKALKKTNIPQFFIVVMGLFYHPVPCTQVALAWETQWHCRQASHYVAYKVMLATYKKEWK